jgi:ubiquinone/menaquinone biosynthesis C-methylase UbiE
MKSTAFVVVPISNSIKNNNFLLFLQTETSINGDSDDGDDDKNDAYCSNQCQCRRQVFFDILRQSVSAVTVIGGFPRVSHGLAAITSPPLESLTKYDLPRNLLQDAAFAQGMSVGMIDYEKESYPTKKKLFRQLFESLSSNRNNDNNVNMKEIVIAEVGMGSFPNALYYKDQHGLDIIGIDPNDRMEGYAKDSASRAGLLSNNMGNSLRIVHGVSETLPLEDNSCDAIVCTLTLCSVTDPIRSVSEIKRVLKPGGKFLFWEHVLSQTDSKLANYQIEMTPSQVKRADGCHLDRKTGDVICSAGFQSVDLQYMELEKFGFLNPTCFGIATA